MVELLSTMWAYLVGSSAIGLILGWAFRGAFLPRPKTVSVSAPTLEPAPAKLTDAQQVALEKAENADATIAALEKRIKDAQDTTASLQNELNDRDQKIATLETSLAEKGNDIPPMPYEEPAENVSTAKLTWKNRYLESRVRHLETQISTASAVAETAPVQDDTSESIRAELEATKSELATVLGSSTRLPMLEDELAVAKGLAQESESKLMLALAERDELSAKLEPLKTLNFRMPILENLLKTAEEKVSKSEAKIIEVESERDALAAKLEEQTSIPSDLAEPSTELINDMAKLRWQNQYLRARISHVEANTSQPVVAPAAPVEEDTQQIAALEAEVAGLKSELTKSADQDTSAEQDLAKLRWRNRYLEGRLKYLEAASLDAVSEAESNTVPAEASEKLLDTPVESAAPIPSIPAENEVRPESLDMPNAPGADDLKIIGGIGPKIEGILNELGIFHYAQVANWSIEEASWIDSYLRFQGRVHRENWVEQAKSLAAG